MSRFIKLTAATNRVVIIIRAKDILEVHESPQGGSYVFAKKSDGCRYVVTETVHEIHRLLSEA